MIVFAGFTPHTPLLVPNVGKDAHKKMALTVGSMERLGDELYAAMPDTIVVISAHAIQHDDAFSANLHDPYRVDLSAFGDLATSRTYESNASLIDAIQRAVRRAQLPFTLDSSPTLDYGSAVPLLAMLPESFRPRVVPISYGGLDAKAQFDFGRALKDVLSSRPERIAVIASGDLAHCLTSDAPSGFKPEGAVFDASVREAVEQASASRLLALDQDVVEASDECGYRPLLVELGVLDGMHLRPEVFSYEFPFGVGYLVAQFHLA